MATVKTRNKRGKVSRTTYTQEIQEAEFLSKRNEKNEIVKVKNPRYPGKRTITHKIVPPIPAGLLAKYDRDAKASLEKTEENVQDDNATVKELDAKEKQ